MLHHYSMKWFKEKLKHYTEGKHAIPTLRGVLANNICHSGE